MCPTNAAKVLSAGVMLALAASLVAAEAKEEPAVMRVRIGAPFSAGAVQRALAGARRRLERPACQRIFTDFDDKSGRPLREALDRAGVSGGDYLDTLLFYDGTGQGKCLSRATLAFTWPGSQVVFVCGPQFANMSLRDPFLAEAALIHEGLHSLGLGENPPTSAAITARVMSRCRR